MTRTENVSGGGHRVLVAAASKPDAKALADRIAVRRPQPAVWLFSSGPVGDPPKPDEAPVDVAAIIDATSAREHPIFAGRIDRSRLGFAERAVAIALRVQDGDFRDWDTITDWANGIADAVHAMPERQDPPTR